MLNLSLELLLPRLRLFSIFLVSISYVNGQNIDSICKKTQEKTEIIDIAKVFLGKPYIPNTLEINKQESLVCNFAGFDCATFVENVTAFYLSSDDCSLSNFKTHLKALRYQNNIIDGYGSRIHYFSDWLLKNKETGLKIISQELGGIPMNKKINFMTQNASKYPKIDKKALEKIKAVESEMANSNLYYIPKEQVYKMVNLLKDGDIVAFTSTIAGLDVNHEGFVIKQNGQVKILHASAEKNKIVVSNETLIQYLNRIKKHSGIIVARFS